MRYAIEFCAKVAAALGRDRSMVVVRCVTLELARVPSGQVLLIEAGALELARQCKSELASRDKEGEPRNGKTK